MTCFLSRSGTDYHNATWTYIAKLWKPRWHYCTQPNENDHQATTCMKLLTEVCSLFVIYINEMAVVNTQNILQEDLHSTQDRALSRVVFKVSWTVQLLHNVTFALQSVYYFTILSSLRWVRNVWSVETQDEIKHLKCFIHIICSIIDRDG